MSPCQPFELPRWLRELGQILEEVARLGVKLLLQVVLEAELTEFLGRDRYARSAVSGRARDCATGIRTSRSRAWPARSRLRSPRCLLGISDGAPGLVSAFEQAFDQSLRQRYLVHRAGNVVAKVAKVDQHEVKKDFWSIFNDIEAVPGREAVAVAEARATDFGRKWGDRYPSAVACLTAGFSSLTTFLHFPVEHRERIRHTNLLERTFGESRRRVKVIGRLPGEYSCLSLVWAALDRASSGWRGLEMTATGIRRLQDVRRQLLGATPLEATA